ncbi:MAG TPA: hypothetical protein VHA12_01365 [Candidatus Nanoarchaeia archaeon]|nr:hypothetical protein [Candidatus Nanoarchaeia archaeon]
MRFKKLKIVVGIAIVLFILMVANTIAFGILYEKPLAPVDNKSGSIRLVEIPVQDTNSVSENASNTTATSTETTVVKTVLPPVDSTTTTVKQTRRTRAS